jgi:hypothetical protein
VKVASTALNYRIVGNKPLARSADARIFNHRWTQDLLRMEDEFDSLERMRARGLMLLSGVLGNRELLKLDIGQIN